MTRVDLYHWIREAGLADYWPGLEPLLLPALTITTTPAQTEIPLAMSRFGGAPDLPDDFVWPTTTKGRPLRFLCQINLAETMPRLDGEDALPSSGLLSFFYYDAYYFENWGATADPEDDEDAAVVIYTDLAKNPVRRWKALPHTAFAPVHLEFAEEVTAPEAQSARVERLLENPQDAERYYRLFRNTTDEESFGHQFLGHAGAFGGDDLTETDPERWRLLLRLGFDESLGWNWGKGGILYFYVPPADLARLDFSRVRTYNWFV